MIFRKSVLLILIYVTHLFAQDSNDYNCQQLGQCFDQLNELLGNTTEILESYYQDQLRKVTTIQDESARMLTMTALSQRYLALCKGILHAEEHPLHLIIEGEAFYRDDQNFTLAAKTQYQRRLEDECWPHLTPECEKKIMWLKNPSKTELSLLFSLLPENSLKSVTYVGHGLNNALVLGEKNLLLPAVYSTDIAITQEQWYALSDHTLYEYDFFSNDSLGNNLQKALIHKANIEIYSCNSGQSLCKVLHHVAKEKDCSVLGCSDGVVFRYKINRWTGTTKNPGDNPVPRDAEVVWLVSSGFIDDFGLVKSGKSSSPLPKPTQSQIPASDRPYRDIILRLYYESGDRALVPSRGPGSTDQELLVFTPEEARILRELMKDYIHPTDSKYVKKFGKAEFELLEVEYDSEHPQLFDKIRRYVDASKKLYYSNSK